MAIKYYEKYPQRWESPSQDYPQGAFKNLSALGEQDGSYLEASWLNDQSGFFGALLRNAEMTPNGLVDTAQKSQFYEALLVCARKAVNIGDYYTKEQVDGKIVEEWGDRSDATLSQKFIKNNLGYVTPEMFGAVGDGLTDDYGALKKCLDTASEYCIPAIFKNGRTYLTKTNLLIRSNTRLNLNGSTILRGFDQTSIGLTFVNIIKDGENITIDNGVLDNNYRISNEGNIVTITGAQNLLIRNVTFKYVKNVHALDLCNYSNIMVDSCTFEGFIATDSTREYSEAIQIDPCYHLDGVSINKNITVKNCQFIPPTEAGTGYGAWAVGVGNHSLNTYKSSVEGVFIHNCYFKDCLYAGVRSYGWDTVVVDECNFEGCYRGIELMTGTGSKVSGSTNVKISGNKFSNGTIGIETSTVSSNHAEADLKEYANNNITIFNNAFKNLISMGVFIKNTKNINIFQNTFDGDFVGIQTHINNYVYLDSIFIRFNIFKNSQITFYRSKSTNLYIEVNSFYKDSGRIVHLTGDGTDCFNSTFIRNNKIFTVDGAFDLDNTLSDNVVCTHNFITGYKLHNYSTGINCEYTDNITSGLDSITPSIVSKSVLLNHTIHLNNDPSEILIPNYYAGRNGSILKVITPTRLVQYKRVLDEWVEF